MSYNICDELIFEIFTKLPPKSLLRFRSLSKSWYSCICSPDFIRMHTLRSQQKLLIRQEGYDYKEFYTIHSQDQLPLCPRRGYFGITPVEFPYSRYSQIVGSCKGILCLFDYEENRISLWNPSIRRKLTLPRCPRRCFNGIEIGFGFDPITDDYKIVSISSPGFRGIVETSFVYAMKTGAWCPIASTPTPMFYNVLSSACFVNGALHWVVEECEYILTFDLSTHVFGMIALPEPTWKTSELTAVQDSLVVHLRDCDNSWIWAWREHDNTASWFEVLKLKRDHVFEGGLMGVLQPTDINGDFLLLFEGFHVYNPKTRVPPSQLLDFCSSSCIVGLETCIESLHLLDMEIATHESPDEMDMS